jgi:hypothetical protein
MRTKIVDSLTPLERDAFNGLASEHEREGFLIVRAFSKTAEHESKHDFAISQSSLADRLNITPPGAAYVIRKLCGVKVIQQTRPSVRHKAPARFRWVANKLTQAREIDVAPDHPTSNTALKMAHHMHTPGPTM